MKENKMNLIESFKERLPDSYIELIKSNMESPSELNSSHFMPIESELMSIFDWEYSNEGYGFWNEVHLYLIGLGDLPPAPVELEYGRDTIFYSEKHLHVMNVGGTGICIKYDVEPSNFRNDLKEDLREKVLSILN